MLIPFLVVYVVAAVTLGGGTLLMFGALAFIKRRPKPAAKWLKLSFIPIGVGLVVLALAFLVGSRVIVLERGAKGPVRYEKQLLLGSATVTVGGKSVEISASSGTTWIVNNTDFEAHIVPVDYGKSSGEQKVDIAPYTAYLHEGDAMDYIGPEDSPGETTTSRGDSAVEYWLSWSRPPKPKD